MKNEDLFRAMGAAGDDQNQYAVTYVPAVHVEGLAEYFEAQKAVHESNVQQ